MESKLTEALYKLPLLIKRRHVFKNILWVTLVVVSVSLPLHGSSSELNTTNTPDIPSCTTGNVWNGSNQTINGQFYYLSFDGITGVWTPTFPPASNVIFCLDHNGSGEQFGPVGSPDWTVTGAGISDFILGFDPGIEAVTLMATNTQTQAVFRICVLTTRNTDSPDGPTTVEISISGPI